MSILTPAQHLLVNTHPQRTQLFLSIYEPDIGFVCTVTGSYDDTNQLIDYINPSGSTANIIAGLYQVALVGTAPNDDSKGRTWVRYASGSSMRFVESDHIDWASGDVVTVLNYTEIIPLFPRIIQNPADETDVIFYKVWDIAYTNQNEIMGSFVNMGCHYAGFKDDNGQYRVYWTASGTSNLIGDSLTYLWDFGVGNPTGSTAHTPGWVVYPAAGHYRNILRVTSDSGREDIAVRYVSLYDRPSAGSALPIVNWEFSEPANGSRDSTGYTWRIRIREDVPKTTIRDGMMVVIFADEWYGATRQSIGGSSEHRETVKFVGYIKDGTIQTNYADHSIEFECQSPTGVMEYSECFSVSVESVSSPTTWYELQDMNIQKAIYHYLAWHSTVLQVCDVRSNFQDRYIQYFDADRTSLYDSINTLISGARRGRVVSDRQGMIWLEQEAEAIVSGSVYFSKALDITKNEWIGEPIIDEVQTDEVAFIEIGGIAYYPATGGFSALLCDAPGRGPRYKGKVERIQGLALDSQAELNDMAGQMLAWFNARYKAEYKLRGNFSNIDIAPQEKFSVTMQANENNRGLSWNAKDFVQRGITWNWDAKAQLFYPTVRLNEIVNGFPGETIVIPDVPPTSGGGGSFNQPPINVPPLPGAISLATGTTTLFTEDNFLELHDAINQINDNSDWEIIDSKKYFKWSQVNIDQNHLWSNAVPHQINLYDYGFYYVYFECDISAGSPGDELWCVPKITFFDAGNVKRFVINGRLQQNSSGGDGFETASKVVAQGWVSKSIQIGSTIYALRYVQISIDGYNYTIMSNVMSIYNAFFQMRRISSTVLPMLNQGRAA